MVIIFLKLLILSLLQVITAYAASALSLSKVELPEAVIETDSE